MDKYVKEYAHYRWMFFERLIMHGGLVFNSPIILEYFHKIEYNSMWYCFLLFIVFAYLMMAISDMVHIMIGMSLSKMRNTMEAEKEKS